MAIRVTLLVLLAGTAFVAAALAEVATAAAAAATTAQSSRADPTTAPSSSAASAQLLHQRLLFGLKGQWSTLWEHPVFISPAALTAAGGLGVGGSAEGEGEGRESSLEGTDAAFVAELAANGFALTKINGTIGWINATTGAGRHTTRGGPQSQNQQSQNASSSSISSSSVPSLGELPTDDSLVWAMMRPDRTAVDRIAVFSAPSDKGVEGGVSSSSSSSSYSYFLPFLHADLLAVYGGFDGAQRLGADAQKDGGEERMDASNFDFSTPHSIGVSVRDLGDLTNPLRTASDQKGKANGLDGRGSTPSLLAAGYGYVLCGEQSTIIPTRPHRTDVGEEFAKARRVVAAGGVAPEYLTRVSVARGFVFPLSSPSGTLTAAEAEKRYCSGASSAPSSSSGSGFSLSSLLAGINGSGTKQKGTSNTNADSGLTPLTITTIGSAGAPLSASDSTSSVQYGLYGKGNADGQWELDSIEIDFGLLAHERAALRALLTAATSLVDTADNEGGGGAGSVRAAAAKGGGRLIDAFTYVSRLYGEVGDEDEEDAEAEGASEALRGLLDSDPAIEAARIKKLAKLKSKARAVMSKHVRFQEGLLDHYPSSADGSEGVEGGGGGDGESKSQESRGDAKRTPTGAAAVVGGGRSLVNSHPLLAALRAETAHFRLSDDSDEFFDADGMNLAVVAEMGVLRRRLADYVSSSSSEGEGAAKKAEKTSISSSSPPKSLAAIRRAEALLMGATHGQLRHRITLRRTKRPDEAGEDKDLTLFDVIGRLFGNYWKMFAAAFVIIFARFYAGMRLNQKKLERARATLSAEQQSVMDQTLASAEAARLRAEKERLARYNAEEAAKDAAKQQLRQRQQLQQPQKQQQHEEKKEAREEDSPPLPAPSTAPPSPQSPPKNQQQQHQGAGKKKGGGGKKK